MIPKSVCFTVVSPVYWPSFSVMRTVIGGVCPRSVQPPLAGSLCACGPEDDLLIVLAVEHFRAQHRLLHFGAIFLGLVLVDHAQRPRIHVYFNRSLRVRVRRTAPNRRAHFVPCPSPENTPVLPTWIVSVDFCVSILCCWALAPIARIKLIAAKNAVRLINHLATGVSLYLKTWYCPDNSWECSRVITSAGFRI